MLSDWGIPFIEKDITRDPAAVEEMLRFRGVAPLTVVDGIPVSNLTAADLEALLAEEDAEALTGTKDRLPQGVGIQSKCLGGLGLVGLGARIKGTLRGWGMTFMYVTLANLLAPAEKPWGFKTLAIKRHRMRLLANKLGVRQRSRLGSGAFPLARRFRAYPRWRS